ncbi:MAG: hypothetical protein D6795_12505 [Deltaproteobacteria bacterium]|nr:MAG: hypothetical protein D6795_12505 [Deltaproteobacteria bacterium]
MKTIPIWPMVVLLLLPSFAVASDRESAAPPSEGEATKEASPDRSEGEDFETRFDDLDTRIDELDEKIEDLAVEVSQQGTQQRANTFNPAIGMILNGRAILVHPEDWAFAPPGFFLPEEAGPGEEGLSLDESELNLDANVDDKFYGSTTIALLGGEAEVEEAYIETIALPHGLTLKAGRFFSNIGYLERRHTHTDDFAERPLPYELFLGGQFADDGVGLSWVAPTPFFWETGGEAFRGARFPAEGGGHRGFGTWTLHSHVGGDIGDSQSWRLGISWLQARVEGRTDETTEETFQGDSTLLLFDVVWKWAPHGNPYRTNLKVQGEYLRRKETGQLHTASETLPLDTVQPGWYAQTVYQFMPKWRVGIRYARIDPEALPPAFDQTILDSTNHDPQRLSLMLDWSNSEFSRIRLQYNHDASSRQTGDLFLLQYIAAFGAHAAHAY